MVFTLPQSPVQYCADEMQFQHCSNEQIVDLIQIMLVIFYNGQLTRKLNRSLISDNNNFLKTFWSMNVKKAASQLTKF